MFSPATTPGGGKLEECREDLAFIENLPGRKILLRGNHDMFWDAKKTERLNREFSPRLFFLQNNFAVYKDYALVGTKGFAFEGPFYVNYRGQIIGWDEERQIQAKKAGRSGNDPSQGIFPPGIRRRLPEVHHVSPLSAHQRSGKDIALYRNRQRVWR